MNFFEMIKIADDMVAEYCDVWAKKVSELIVDAVFNATGRKLEWSIGWYENGDIWHEADTIFFQYVSNDEILKEKESIGNDRDYKLINLEELLHDLVGEIGDLRLLHFSTGAHIIWFNLKETEQIKKVLREVK